MHSCISCWELFSDASSALRVFIWDEAKRVILSNVSFFLATNVMNSLRMWSVSVYSLEFTDLGSHDVLRRCSSTATTASGSETSFAQNVIIIGTGDDGRDLEMVYGHNRFTFSKIRAIVDCNNSKRLTGISQPVHRFDQEIIPYDSLVEYLKHHDIDESGHCLAGCLQGSDAGHL